MRKIFLSLAIAFFLVIALVSAQSPLTDGLVSYYKLDEVSGIVIDSTGTFNGTNSGATAGTLGKIETAYNFTTVSSGINLTTFDINTTRNFSIVGWFHWNGTTDQIIIGQLDGASSTSAFVDVWDVGGGARLRFCGRNTSGTEFCASSSSIPLTTGFQFFSAVYNGSYLDLRLNNTFQESALVTNGIRDLTTATKWIIGNRNSSANPFRNGAIDEVGVWNRTLNATEITTIYNSGVGLSYPFVRSNIVELISPEDGSTISDTNATFNVSLVTSGNITNATLFIWNSDGDIFNQTTNDVTGNDTNYTNWTIFDFDVGSYVWNVRGCFVNSTSTECIFAPSNFTFTIGVQVINNTYSNTTFVGALENFTTVVQGVPSATFSANLIWNGSSYGGNVTDMGGNQFQLSQQITIPNSVGLNEWFWQVNFGGVIQNLSANEQTVSLIMIDNCTTYSEKVFNFSVVDEAEQTFLSNATLEALVKLFSQDRAVSVQNYSIEQSNPLSICMDFNTSSIEDFKIDVLVKYSSPDYAIEYYNIYNESLSEFPTTQNITLYDLSDSNSTEFQLTFNGLDFLPVENALVYLDRQYISENAFKTVELPLTDSNGKAVLHLVRNDVIYNIRVVQNGVVVGNFENIVAFCEDVLVGNCQIVLQAQQSIEEFTYDEQLGITFSGPSYSSNDSTITFSFTSSSGTSKSVTMNVTRNDVFGNNSLCTTTLNSSSGTLGCNLDENLAETLLIATVYVDGIQAIIQPINVDSDSYGAIGYLAWFVLTLFLIIVSSENKNATLFSMLASYIGAVLLGFTEGTAIGIGSAGVWVLVITFVGLWRINRDKVQ